MVPDTMQNPQIERRVLPRKKIRISAFVERQYGDPLPCQILDMSLVSARIDAGEMALPDTFVLTMKLSSNVQRTCSVVWRSGYAAGVKFKQ